MTPLANCGASLYWRGCYSGSYDLINPESMAHPAKMSVALCYRILDHLKKLGLLQDSDTILDPMGGTGITAICAGAKGYKAITVELEEKFVGFQRQNRDYASRKLYRDLDWTILQGDARRLSELLNEKGLVTVSSPPYEGESSTHKRDRQQDIERMIEKGMKINPNSHSSTVMEFDYGESEGQIGNLKDVPLKVITSPPYAGDGFGKSNTNSGNVVNRNQQVVSRNRSADIAKGQTPHQIKYADQTEGNIANLPDKPLKTLMSPPYDNRLSDRDTRVDRPPTFYSESLDNIGNQNNETYLSAMKIVYAEIAKVSEVLVIVLKNPTRNGRLRRLDLDSIELLKQTGWRIHCQHRALLFEETEQTDLFGETKKKVEGRLSFFKRLAYVKGSPVASFEDILIAVRNKES